MAAGGERIALHVRGHGLTGRELWDRADACVAAARRYGAWVLVNDRVDVALGCGAHGAQLGRESIPPEDARRILPADAVIGASIHDRDEAAAAIRGGADFLVAGTLFRSASHPGGEPKGVAWLGEVAALGRPVIGIGGIDPARVIEVLEAGVYGVAVISAVWNAADPAAAIEDLLSELEDR